MKLGYHLTVERVDPDNPEIEYNTRNVLALEYEGIICLEHYSPKNPARIPGILQNYNNVVYMDAPLENVRSVSINYGSGVAEAVRYLHENGMDKIALCLNDNVYFAVNGRLFGYRQDLE